jgi:peptidoglycan/LPS O-acetylase OafA/YrhL
VSAADPAHRRNNFESLRLVAACLVFVFHAFLFVPGGAYLAVGRTSVGMLGVTLFFAISGFLIAQSWQSDPRLGPFAWKRLLRIMPALWVMLLVTTYVMGPLLTEMSLADYVTAPDTHAYFAGGALMQPANSLPGVFSGQTVNGALWSLPIEVTAYAMLALLGLAGAMRRRGAVLVLAVAFLALALPVGADGAPAGAELGLMEPATVHLMAVFLCATVLCLYRERVPLRASVALALVGLWLASSWTTLQPLTAAIALPYACVFLAYRTPAIRLRGDVSYGVYLYGAPVQMATVWMLGAGVTGPAVIAIAAPVTFGLALASWRFVEAPCLRLKGSVPGRKRGEHVERGGVREAVPARGAL